MVVAVSTEIRPLRRAEYDKLVELGAFEDERIELLEGALVPMSPIGTRHASAIDLLTLLLVRALGDRARIRVQNPFAASDISEPQPDLLVAPLGDYRADHPAEAYLVIEVAESSLAKDRGVKLRIYAERGVPEYWVVNVVARQVEVFRAPEGGTYRESRTFELGDTISLGAFPDVSIALSKII
ncbi:MAG TPA: Uma2 family endonuclease, partial [Polyangiaceae bacterium]|nr:Uma2 family endonuclease [Polyangiaceae bacterium]